MYDILLEEKSGRLRPIRVYECEELKMNAVVVDKPCLEQLDSDSFDLLSTGFERFNQSEILIGADHFWDLLDGSRTKLSSGFWLINGVFGPALSGKGADKRTARFNVKKAST
jgi:hypothetical protein